MFFTNYLDITRINFHSIAIPLHFQEIILSSQSIIPTLFINSNHHQFFHCLNLHLQVYYLPFLAFYQYYSLRIARKQVLLLHGMPRIINFLRRKLDTVSIFSPLFAEVSKKKLIPFLSIKASPSSNVTCLLLKNNI